uniref:Zona pellucida protein AX 1 n=1 Tax=Acanthochromis polyacanthus TaxID=80966 RepID=A0A3Q1GQ48_9TELE
MTFFTPEPVAMVLREAEQAGYSAMTTSTRLVVRSPYNTAETYMEDVAGVPMEVFKVSTYYKAPQGLSIVNLAAACPTYHITFTVEPMLEVLWKGDNAQDDIKYKILFPITTPLMPTVPEDGVFRVQLGAFLHDVELRNITFSTGVLTVEESNTRGFTVQEHIFPNGTKGYSLQVAFNSDVVMKHNPEALVTVYTLPLVFGFIVLPEETPFAHAEVFHVSLQDVLPILTGTCDHSQFYTSVEYGSQGRNIQTTVGYVPLTRELAESYGFQDNGTHFSLVIPYTAKETIFELFASHYVRARLDILLYDINNQWLLGDLFLTCYFPLTTTCYSNGTITALAMKTQSVPSLNPSRLTLRDPACKPAYSDDRFAHFSFTADSCGTTRTFFDNYMLYENEISISYLDDGAHNDSPVDPEYQTVSCYYMVNKTETLAFSYKPRTYDPKAEIGTGQLMVQMRLSSYDDFYQGQDFPIVKYLRQPLYFEVELMQSSDPHLELILENCWATLQEDRMSLPSWDIIVDCGNRDDSYMTTFHPVVSDTRVAVPSHIKRFSMKMFAFIKDEAVLKDEIFVHCDAVICDTNSQDDGACR